MPKPAKAKKSQSHGIDKALYTKPVNKPKVIIHSKAPKNLDFPGYRFKGWKYITANVQFAKDQQAQVHNVCLDTGCIMTLIDRDFLKEVTPDAIMKKMASPMSVRGVGPRKHSSIDYVTINLYFPRNKRCTAAVH